MNINTLLSHLPTETCRRDGHGDFIKRASEVCGVPRSTIKRWRPQYPNAIYTEVTNDDIETFRATSWRNQQAMPASNAFSAARKIINQIDGLPDVDMESSQAREIMDLSMAFSKVLGSVRRYIECPECKGVILKHPGHL
jgi:hypothetical protein